MMIGPATGGHTVTGPLRLDDYERSPELAETEFHIIKRLATALERNALYGRCLDDVVSLGERMMVAADHLRPVRLFPSPEARAASRHLNYQELSNAMGAPLWHARELLEVLQWIQ